MKKSLIVSCFIFTFSLVKTVSAQRDTTLNHLLVTAGFVAGIPDLGNSAYYLNFRGILLDKINFNLIQYQRSKVEKINNFTIGYGKQICVTSGVEWGNQYYSTGSDSLFSAVRARNNTTGILAPFSNFSFNQKATSFSFGFLFSYREMDRKNYWRGTIASAQDDDEDEDNLLGKGLFLFDCRLEALYAPSIFYDKQIYDGFTYDSLGNEFPVLYDLENVKFQKFAIRYAMEITFNSYISLKYEVGTRPGIKKEVNEEGTFTNFYMRMGIGFALGVGNQKKYNASSNKMYKRKN